MSQSEEGLPQITQTITDLSISVWTLKRYSVLICGNLRSLRQKIARLLAVQSWSKSVARF